MRGAAAAAAAAGPRIPPGGSGGVRDARDLDFVTIDPEGSRDLDQAFFATRRGDGHRVFYAIADVAAFVTPGDPVDAEARRRGVTLYSPDHRTSLYPEVISEGAGSLLAGHDRQALLWTIDLDDRGELERAHLERAMVRSRRQHSYRTAQGHIDRGDDTTLALLREIGTRRRRLEGERGAVSLSLPSQEIVRHADGSYGVIFDETLPIEGWNAQISLLTGIAAASIMIDGGVGLLRTLPEPDERTITRLRRTAAALGLDWPDDTTYANWVRDLRPDTPQRAAMLSQAGRGLRGAGYTAFSDHDLPTQPEHAAIASTYAHVTAPLRRLCDRFTNEIVLSSCAGTAPPAWALEALEALPRLMGTARARERNLDRDLVDFVEAMVLEPLVGTFFDAIVTDVDAERDRGRIQLRDPAVVARTSAAGLRLGATVSVRLTASDPAEGRVRFELG